MNAASPSVQSVDSLVVSLDSVLAPTCLNGNDGAIFISVDGGTGPYSFTWGNGATTEDITDLPVGLYSVSVTDADNNEAVLDNIFVPQPANPLAATLVYELLPTCNGVSGALGVSLTGDAAPFQLTWSNGETTDTITDLPAGVYDLTVADTNGCTASYNYTLAPLFPNVSLTKDGDINCSHSIVELDGSASVLGPNTVFKWEATDGGQFSSPTDVLVVFIDAAGTYSLTLTDTLTGCASTADLAVLVDTLLPVVDAGLDINAPCTNSALTLNASVDVGLNHSFAAQWTTNDGGHIVAGQDTLVLDIDHAGTYVLTVQILENGCSASDTTIVTGNFDPPTVTVDGGTVTCFLPTVTLATQVDTANTSFSWAGPNGFTSDELNPAVLDAGDYVFTVTDTITTCTSIATATVLADNDPPVLTATGGTFTCANPTVTLGFTASTNDISFSWAGPNGFTSDEASPVVNDAGDYTLTATDTLNGCSAVVIASVAVDTLAPSANAGADVNTACTNDVLVLVGSGFADPNLYSITTQWTAFDGGHILLGGNTLTPDIDHAGTYVLMVQIVENGCSSTDTVIVTGDNNPPLLSVAGGTLTCFVPAVLLSAQVDTLNAIFGWTGPNGFTSNELDTLVTEAGDYVFTVTDTATTCTSVATASVLADNDPPVLTATGGNITCVNADVTLSFTSSATDVSFEWTGPNGFASTEPNPTVTELGDYTLSVTDTLNGCSAVTTVTVAIDTIAPVADAGVDSTLTCVVTTLQLGGAATSQGAEFEYAWTTLDGHLGAGQNTATATALANGTYVLTVTNTVNGCTSEDEVFVNENTTVPTVSAQGGTITCAVPTVTLTGTFVANNTSFVWTGPNGFTSTELNPNVSVGGSYTLTVTDTINGCVGSATATVIETNTPPNLQATGGFIGCTLAPVTLTATATGTGITYEWTGPNGFTSAQQNPTVSEQGNYTVTATDQQTGCSTSTTVAVVLNMTPPIASAGGAFSLNCHVAFGKLNGTGSSQGANFTYSWTTANGNILSGVNTLTPTVNAAGTYTLTVTNTLTGCTASASVTVTEALPINIFVTAADAACFGTPTGSANAVVTGGTGTFNYTWSNGVHVPNAFGLVAGTYTVTVTDGNNCSATASATIGQPASALTISVSSTPQSAPGENDGTVSVTANGGTDPYFFHWSNGGTDPMLFGLAPGAYSVTVTDLNGCTAIATANVNTANCTLTASVTTLNVACFGGATGSATVVVANETEPVQYDWSNGSTQPTANGLVAGNYSVTVTDASACVQVLTFEITQPTQLTAVELLHTDASCPSSNDGSLTAAVNGGTQPYSFEWSNGSTTATATNLGVGDYTLTVTDANGCEASFTSSIVGNDTEPPVLVLQDITVSLNANGVANLTAQQFDAGSDDNCGIANWSVSPTSFDCSQIGVHTVTITATDGAGLQSTDTANVTVEDNLAPTLVCPSNITVAACNAAVSFSLPTVSDNCGVDINLLAQTAGLASGTDFPIGTTTQTFEYTDASGNTGTCSFEVNVADAPSFAATLSDVTCAGACDGAVNLTVSGGLQPITVVWSNGGDGTNLCAGSYSVSVTDAGGCGDVLNFTISEPSPLVITTTFANPVCPSDQSGFIQAVVTGGTGSYDYDWSNGGTTADLTGLGTGTYTLNVTDFNGCIATETVTLTSTDSEQPVLSLQNATISLGANGSVALSPGLFDAGSTDNCGIANWTVSPTSFSCGDLGNQTVTLTATDASGNSASGTATVTVVDNIAPAITCPANVAISYCNPTGTFNLPTVTDNCTLNPALLVLTNGLPSGSDFPAGVTTQTFSYTDPAGNNATCSFTVTVSGAATVTPSFTNATCNGACNGTASVAITGGLSPFNVAWSNGATGLTASNLCAGAYEASVTDGAGCLQTLSFTISQPTALQLTVDGVVNDVNGAGIGEIQVSVTGGTTPYIYAWTKNGQAFSTNQDLTNVNTGNYQVVVTDANGCTVSSITVTVQNLTGTSEAAWSEGAVLQPNPASSYTTLVLRKPLTEPLEVQIFDLTGKLVQRRSFGAQTNSVDIDLTGFSAGVYNVQLRSAGSVAVKRLVVGR